MPFKIFGIQLDEVAAFRNFVGKRATRWLDEWLGKIIGGHENFRFFIRQNRDLLSVFPEELIQYYRAKLNVPPNVIQSFSDAQVYQWIPESYRDIIEQEPNGKVWIARQLTHIRSRFLGA